jgi:intracellular septation protein
MTEKPKLDPKLKLVLDLGPLVLFFVTYKYYELFTATGVLMAATVVALAVSYTLTRHLAVMPVVTAVVVLIFGGLSLAFHNESFIKLKPTIIYLLFAGTLTWGYVAGKPLLAMVFDSAFHLTDLGWRKLTLRWIVFFAFLAVLNEIIWRTQSTDFWVSAKVYGFTTLTFAFAMLQLPLLMKHASPETRD